MRIGSRFVIAAVLTLGALLSASAQEAAKAANPEAIVIPPAMLRYYCLNGTGVYSIGAVTCLMSGQRGTCKWTDSGSNHSAPPKRSYWVASPAPAGTCP